MAAAHAAYKLAFAEDAIVILGETPARFCRPACTQHPLFLAFEDCSTQRLWT